MSRGNCGFAMSGGGYLGAVEKFKMIGGGAVGSAMNGSLAVAIAIIAFLLFLLWRKESTTSASAAPHPKPLAPPTGFGPSQMVIVRDGGFGRAPPTNHDLPINPIGDPKYPLRGQTNVPYQQMGVLISEAETPGGEPTILPLLGKPSPTNRDRWQYYTSTDKTHMMRLPVSFENKNCTEDIGCREVQDGENISVPAYKKDFQVQIYKYEKPQYDPNVF